MTQFQHGKSIQRQLSFCKTLIKACHFHSSPAKKGVRVEMSPVRRTSPRKKPVRRLNKENIPSPHKSPRRPAGRVEKKKKQKQKNSKKQTLTRLFACPLFFRLTNQISAQTFCGFKLLLWQAEAHLSHSTGEEGDQGVSAFSSSSFPSFTRGEEEEQEEC